MAASAKSPSSDSFQVDTIVELHSLKKQKWLNGVVGNIVGPYDGGKQRYPVMLALTQYAIVASEKYQTITAKPENLKKPPCLHGSNPEDFWSPAHGASLNYSEIDLRDHRQQMKCMARNRDVFMTDGFQRHVFAEAARQYQQQNSRKCQKLLSVGLITRHFDISRTSDRHNKKLQYIEMTKKVEGQAIVLFKHLPCNCFKAEKNGCATS
jgi:hypothetical protein